jgi:4-amino-4-deoxy-L-arabinose transferase-like glycosyltransferase
MSSSDRVPAAPRVASMEVSAARHPRARAPARGRVALRIRAPRLSVYAWGAVAATAAFIAMTYWWLTQDTSIPIYDAGNHLETAFRFEQMLKSGNLLGPINYESVYPPIGHLVAAFGALIGGVNVASPIVANNLVFVSLLALGCYRTGRLLFGPAAGMLAVIFVLGSPLLIENLHVFMLDPNITALVAVTIWLLLASEDFRRADLSALAGLAAAVGMLVKVQFALYVAGLVIVMLARGGWRNPRGFAAFLAVSIAVGLPWYIDHSSLIGPMLEVASAHPHNSAYAVPPPPGNVPPTLTVRNLLWYFWSVLNLQLLTLLFIVAAAGTVWTAVWLVRARRPLQGRLVESPRAAAAGPAQSRERRQWAGRLELLLGGFLTWLIITITPHHDVRYGLPLLAYVAVVATGWIVCVPRVPRFAAIALLALGVAANTLGITFGVGRERTIGLASRLPATQQLPDRVILYPATGFLSSGPSRDGDVPGLLKALHDNGVRAVTWSLAQSASATFSFEGLLPLARIAGLEAGITEQPEYNNTPLAATLIHQPITAHSPPTCARVKNITEVWVPRSTGAVSGVWVARWDAAANKIALYCPWRHPQYYSIGNA